MKKLTLFIVLSACLSFSLAKGKAETNDTIDANQWTKTLGKSYKSQLIQAFKKRYKANKPEIDFEEATAFWSFYDKAGVDFIFADEAIFTNKESKDIGLGNIYLTDINFYNGGDCVFYQNRHVLPFGVKYDDSYEDVVAKMKVAGGKHKISDKAGENWWALKRKDGKRYGVSFTFDENIGVTEAKIQYYFGQDHMEWMD